MKKFLFNTIVGLIFILFIGLLIFMLLAPTENVKKAREAIDSLNKGDTIIQVVGNDNPFIEYQPDTFIVEEVRGDYIKYYMPKYDTCSSSNFRLKLTNKKVYDIKFKRKSLWK